jgi:site-specific recombinase XerD
MTYLEEKETQSLLDAVDSTARMGLRDQALFLLMYNTGARVSEIVNLRVDDLRLDESPQVQVVGKGQKHRTCPLWPETAEALPAYLRQRAAQDPCCDQVFLNAKGLRLSRFGVRHILRKYVARAQPACPSRAGKRVSPHTLRHTTAMQLLRSGNDINMISYWLGHADINSTYVQLSIVSCRGDSEQRTMDQEPALVAIRAADAGETLVQVAALQKGLHEAFDDRAPRSSAAG